MRRYAKPTDKRLLAECAALSPKSGGQYAPVKCWSPSGVYWVATAATHEDIAGSLVADGLPECEYWDVVVSGYRATVSAYARQETRRMAAEYARGWAQRYTQDCAALHG